MTLPLARISNCAKLFSVPLLSGYTGDGLTCSDSDECASKPCDPNATCKNTAGGFTCTCNSGKRATVNLNLVELTDWYSNIGLVSTSTIGFVGKGVGIGSCTSTPTTPRPTTPRPNGAGGLSNVPSLVPSISNGPTTSPGRTITFNPSAGPSTSHEPSITNVPSIAPPLFRCPNSDRWSK
jgi:hypothetical protein